MADLQFSQVILYTFNKANPQTITVPSGKIYKIESAGIGGTNGAIFLRTNFGSPVVPDSTRVAIIFTTVGDDNFSSPLPYWLPAGFTGNLYADTENVATVSITEYLVV